MEQQTQSQNSADLADKKQRSFLHKFAEIVKESIRWDDLLICFASVSLVESLTLSIFGSLLVIYFRLSIICTLLRDILQISPAGWKERSVLRKLACIAEAAYFGCLGTFINMYHEWSVIREKEKEWDAFMSTRNEKLEEIMRCWKKDSTDLRKQLSASRNEIRSYERRSSELKTQATNLKKALESAEARENHLRRLVKISREQQHGSRMKIAALEEVISNLQPDVSVERTAKKEQLDEIKLKIKALRMRPGSIVVEDQQLRVVKLNETIEKLKMEKDELYARLHFATGKHETVKAKLEALSAENKETKAKLENEIKALSTKHGEDEIKALSTEHEATKAKLEDEIKALSTEHEATEAKLEDEIKALSTEHEATKAKLEDEKNELNGKLQIANESAEFQQKLLQEYHLI